MEIKYLLENYKVQKKESFYPKSERAEIIKKFVDRLNDDRKSSGRKALGANVYAIKMAEAGLKSNQDLYWFYRYCDDAKNFSSCWWWSLNPKNAK